jgi:hypothetical protein
MIKTNILKPLTISLLFIILVLTHFSGTITGDEEKVYNFVDSYLRNNISFFEWLKNPLDDCEIWLKCHSTFFKHNFAWFLINGLIIKFTQSILFFYNDFLNNTFLVELVLSFFNSMCFFLSFFVLYKNFYKKFGSHITIATIILFIYGTYINNFVAGGYIECIIMLILSFRICYLGKENLTKFDIIIISFLDVLLISLRFFYFWVILIFFIIHLITLTNKKNIKFFYTYYLLVPLIFLFSFYYLQSSIPTKAYFNTNELKDIGFLDYYLIKITRSFCVNDIISIVSILLQRIYLSFFSFSVGLFFIFPLIILTLTYYKERVYLLKILILFGFIGAYSLEQNFYLPAGISGHRGIAPILLIFFPEILNSISRLSKSNKNKIISVFLSLLIIIFSSSIFYRSTLSHYTVFTKLAVNADEKILNSKDISTKNNVNVLTTQKEVPLCYKQDTFSHGAIDLHSGIFGWKFLFLNITNAKEASISSKLGKRIISLKDFTPQTLIHKVNYLIQYDFYNYEDNPLKAVFTNNNYLVKLSKFIYFLSTFLILIIPTILFNYLFFLKKNTFPILKKDRHQL